MTRRRFNKGPGGVNIDRNDPFRSERAAAKTKRMFARQEAERKRKAEFEKSVEEFYKKYPKEPNA